MPYKILSIDAWGNQTDGYDWNQWFTVGSVVSIPETDQGKIKLLIDEGFLNPKEVNQIEVEDDQYNYIFVDKKSGKPLYALEYGANK